MSGPIFSFHDSNLGDRIPLLTEMEDGSNPSRGAILLRGRLEVVPAHSHKVKYGGSTPPPATILSGSASMN